MSGLALFFCVAVTAAAPMKIAAPGLSYVGLAEKEGDLFLDYFAQKLVERGQVKVIHKADVLAMIGAERQRQLVGCADSGSSCIAELAGALDVDALVTGSIGKTGDAYVVNLRVVRQRDGDVLASASGREKSSDGVLDLLDRMARQLVGDLEARTAGPAAPARWPPFLALGVGAVTFAVGVSFYGLARGSESSLRTGNGLASPGDVTIVKAAGHMQETVGFVLGGVGLALLVVGLVLKLVMP